MASGSDIKSLVAEWFRRKNLTPACHVCGAKEVKTGAVCDMPNHANSSQLFGVIPLVCTECASTTFLDMQAVLDGLQSKAE